MITADALRAIDFGSANIRTFRAAFPSGLDIAVTTANEAASAGVDIVTLAQVAEDPAWLAWLATSSNLDVLELTAMSAATDASTLGYLSGLTGPKVLIDGVEVDQHAAIREAALRNPNAPKAALLAAAPSAAPDEAVSIRSNPTADAEVLALLPS